MKLTKLKSFTKYWGGFTESEKGKQLKEKQKVEEEWGEVEEINNLSKVNQSGQSGALELKGKEGKIITYLK